MDTNKKQRVETLDYLRGILAFSVMIYHYKIWTQTTFPYPFEQLFERAGIYAVSTFYILSGASLAIVYGNRTVNRPFLTEFAIKRYFRIAPLFMIATTLTLIPPIVKSLLTHTWAGIPSLPVIAANYTLLFSWLRPSAYIATGAWSIGNELVFYSVFPFLILSLHRSRYLYGALIASTIAIALALAFFAFDRNSLLLHQWKLYINPFNQMYLFVGGVAIGILLKRGVALPSRWSLALLLLAVTAFVFWPVGGDQIRLVSGFERVLFSCVAFAICFAAATMGKSLKPIPAAVMNYLGYTSFSLYLLHPIVYKWGSLANEMTFGINDRILAFVVFLPVTLILAHFTYRLLEVPFINLGKRVASRVPAAEKKPADRTILATTGADA